MCKKARTARACLPFSTYFSDFRRFTAFYSSGKLPCETIVTGEWGKESPFWMGMLNDLQTTGSKTSYMSISIQSVATTSAAFSVRLFTIRCLFAEHWLEGVNPYVFQIPKNSQLEICRVNQLD